MDRRLDSFTQHIIQLAKQTADCSGVGETLRRVAKDYWRHHDDAIATASQGTQIQLAMAYRELAGRGDPLPPFDEVEFKIYSQNGEDGILLLLFSVLG